MFGVGLPSLEAAVATSEYGSAASTFSVVTARGLASAPFDLSDLGKPSAGAAGCLSLAPLSATVFERVKRPKEPRLAIAFLAGFVDVPLGEVSGFATVDPGASYDWATLPCSRPASDFEVLFPISPGVPLFGGRNWFPILLDERRDELIISRLKLPCRGDLTRYSA